MNETAREIGTSCVLDCPDACSLEVTVEGGRVTRIGPGTGNDVTRDFICSKVGRFADRLYHPDRLLYPMRRVGPKGEARFERIDWGPALATITERFREIRDTHGGEAILPYNYGGSNGFLTDDLVDSAYFAGLGASRLGKTICAAPTSEVAKGMYGKMAGVGFPDYPEAELILIWGANPRASNIHLVPFLRDAKARGAFIALVDPVRTLSTDLIDLHLPVYPGADLPLALGMIHHWAETGRLDRAFLDVNAVELETLLEAASEWSLDRAAKESRVDRESILLLADRYANASPAILRCGWGLERNRNGGQAAAAVLAMPALLGKFGRRGGGFTLSNSGAGKLDASKLWKTSSWTTRVINMTELARVLNEPDNLNGPPIRGLFVYNCNPVATVPDQNGILRGLLREDLFTVVFEQVMTDTARYADILLPATTFLEHYDFKRSYGSYVVGATKPVIEPCGEARSNVSVFAELGRALGFEDGIFHWPEAELRERAVAAIELQGKPVSPEPFTTGGIHRYDFDGAPNPVQFESVFPQTEDGKVHLAPACLGPAPYAYEEIHSESFPLCLITPASAKLVSSTFGEFNVQELHLTIHPDDARSRGIASGDRVRVWNDLGEVECVARVDAHVREGVVSLPKGAWMKSSLNGRTSTALTPSNVNVVGGGACFNDARVEVAVLH
jgi:anaerobic selenocysteine-containing dehydrogenase